VPVVLLWLALAVVLDEDVVPVVLLLVSAPEAWPRRPGSSAMICAGGPSPDADDVPPPAHGCPDPAVLPCVPGIPPLRSPAGPGAIGPPPGPVRCCGMVDPDGPGATRAPPGPTRPVPPGAAAPVSLVPDVPVDVPPVVPLLAAPPADPPAPPPAEPPDEPPLCASATTALDASHTAAMREICLPIRAIAASL
jgi:hypothetical protein